MKNKYQLEMTNDYIKQARLCLKRGYDMSLLKDIVNILQSGEELPLKHKQHKLSGKYRRCWECHIKPDWLLVWKEDDQKLILLLLATGTHSDLF